MVKYDDNIYTEIASLSSEERCRLVDTMERDIIHNNKSYDRRYFKYLEIYLNESRINANSFAQYKESCYYLEKLQWLKPKNIEIIYYEKEREIVENIKEVLPNKMRKTLLDLLDLQVEREREIYIK